jgi:hypothetical protein
MPLDKRTAAWTALGTLFVVVWALPLWLRSLVAVVAVLVGVAVWVLR